VVVLSLAAGGRASTAGPVTRRLGRRGLRRIAALAAIAVMSLAVLAGPAMLARYIEDGEAAERVSLAVVSGRMIVGHPLTGVGPGMWAAERIANTVPPEVDVYVADPGDGYLQVAAELGIVGLLAGLFGLACVAVLVRSALADESAARRRWGSAGLAVTVYAAAHLLLGNLTASPVALFLLAVPIAWIDASETRPLFVLPERLEEELAADGERVRTILLGAGLAVVGLAIAWSVLTERSALDMDQARTAADANDWAGALRPLANATSTDPDNPASLLPLGLAWARTGDAGKALASLARLSEAEDLPVAWMNRAWLEAAAGDAIAARRSLNRALALGAGQPQLALTAGLIHEQLGDLPESTSWYIETLVQEPRLAGSGFWQSSQRVVRWDTIRTAALARLAPADAADFWISAGDLEEAKAVVDAMPAGDERTLLELVVAAWAGRRAPGRPRAARETTPTTSRPSPGRHASRPRERCRGCARPEWLAIANGGRPARDTDLIISCRRSPRLQKRVTSSSGAPTPTGSTPRRSAGRHPRSPGAVAGISDRDP
jgi:tetratricopeptide (TPR) repeat protein